MRIAFQIHFLVFTLVFFTSCSQEYKKSTVGHFDLASYFDKQAALLKKDEIKLKKFVTKDTLTEEKLFDTVNWAEELKPFSECDINKPAWKNAYQTDSVSDNGTLCIKYMAKDSALKIKTINICFEQGILTLINIEKRNENMYTSYTTSLTYIPLKAYLIKTRQKVSMTKQTSTEINGLFKK